MYFSNENVYCAHTLDKLEKVGFLGFSLGKRGLKWVLAEEKGFFMEFFEQREGEGLGGGYHSNQRLEQSYDRVDHSPWWTIVSLNKLI